MRPLKPLWVLKNWNIYTFDVLSFPVTVNIIFIFIFIIESYTKYKNTYRVHAHIHKDKTDDRNDWKANADI